jgi:hypothetical protein
MKTKSSQFFCKTVCFVKRGMPMLPGISQSLLLCGGLLLASAAGSADTKPASKEAGNATVPPAGSALSAAKAGVDEAALAAQRRASEAAALSNVEMRSPAKAAAEEAAVAAQLRAVEAAALSNVELSGQTKAGVNEAGVAAQLRAAEAGALINVELSDQAKAGVDEAALAAQLKAAQAAAFANVELSGQTKAGVDEAAVAVQLRAAEAAALSNLEMRSPAKAAAEAAAQRAGAQTLAPATSAAAGAVSIGPAVKPSASGPSSARGVAPFGPGIISPTCQQQGKLPPLPTNQLNDLLKADTARDKGPYQIGVGRVFDQPVIVDSTTAPAAAWRLLPNGWRIWLMDVASEGALGLRVHLESVLLPEGVRIVVYDPANPAPEATPITAQSLHGEFEVWTESIFSSHVVVECQVPPGVDPATVSFRVTELSHFFRSLFPKPAEAGSKAAESCENDVTCYPAWAGEASGVARITFIKSGSLYLCTGCLLNTATTTFIDYFLTANHCIGDQTTASTLEAYWFYQTSTCNGTPPSLGSVPHTTGGADLLATQTRAAGNDFCFLRLRSPAPGGAEYAGWDTAAPAGADTLTSIHHPAADYKRISFGNTTGNDANWWHLQWYSGVTEHGSSGCPLYSVGHRVIGQLWGGDSDCATPSGIDDYGRFNVTYNAINYWLYPPANDVVGGAVTLPDRLTYTSQWTTNATDDTGLTCSGTISKGIWFSYTPTLTGTGIVDTCASTFDTKIQIYNSAMTSLGCNDDACGASGLQSSFSFACTAGQVYYICAGGYNGSQGQLQIRAHSVCASSAVPGNDGCSGAYTLSDSPFYYWENTVCASDDTGLPCTGGGTIYNGVWFNYTPAVNGNATVDTCGSDFDTKLIIFSGTCGALTLIGCSDDSPACGSGSYQSSYTFPCTAGTTYRICAGGYGGYSGNLKIRAQAYCTSGTLYNDTCSSPYYLMDSRNYTWENTACGNDDTSLPCSGTISKGVWFYYTPTVSGTSVVDTCGSDFDTKIEIFTGACGSLGSVGCNDDSCGLQSRFSFPCTAGTTYRICAGGFAGHSGNLYIRAYSICNSAPPSNDTCTNAWALWDSLVYSSEYTACAIDDTNVPCTGENTIYRGVWYQFTATATGTATVDTCGSDFDTKIVVLTNACSSLGSVGCNDDSCGLQSVVSFPCIAGTSYLICAGGYGGHGGNLQIRAYSACNSGPPANDTCAGASYLPDAQTYTALTTTCAMDDTNLPCINEGTIYRGVWFKYTPSVNGNATVDTCTSDFDTKLIIFSGTCGALTLIGCNDDSSACGSGSVQSSYTFPCTVGVTYYICAGGYGGHAGNLKLRAYSVCTGTPANDLCSGAVALAENSYYGQNTGCGTDDSGLPCLGTGYHGVWFTYTPAVSGWAVVDTCPSDFDTKIEVFSGACGALSSIGCNDDSATCGSGGWSLQSSFGFSCTAGTTYHICAGGWAGAFGNLQIRARTTVPPNDLCDGAFGLSDSVYYAENTGTATDDATASCVSYGTIFKGVWFYYTPVRTGTLAVDTCPSLFDTKIQVFSGACGALTSLGCNDDSPVCGGSTSRQSWLSIPVACGTTYYVCAGGFYTNYSGPLQIRATLTPARPPLAITRAGTNVVISWPTNYPCFTLYSATNLPALPAAWLVVPPPPTIVGGNYTVTDAIGLFQRFYRLQ